MAKNPVGIAIERLIGYLATHPEECRRVDQPATAILQEDLRCRVTALDGQSIDTDMAVGLGGGGTAPSPGWFFRASIAACNATTIAMRAARLGIALNRLEITVHSESDRRGLLGMDEFVAPGPLRMNVGVKLGAEGIDPAKLREIVCWAHGHSPMTDAIARAVETKVDVHVA
jgi:uncharacterized OsmC-like protein